jgi:shikimate kinase
MRVVLIGFMGSGKSTIAPILGRIVGIPAVDLDIVVASQAGFSSIAAFVDAKGMDAFRSKEEEVVKTLLTRREYILACGGGTFEPAESQEALKASGATVMYLKTSFASVERRIPDPASRPLLRDREKAQALFNSRRDHYAALAHHTIDTDDLSPEQVTYEIAAILGS